MNGSLLAAEPIVVWPPPAEPFWDPIDEPADPIPDVTDDREDKFDTELDADAEVVADADTEDDRDDDADEWLLLLLGLWWRCWDMAALVREPTAATVESLRAIGDATDMLELERSWWSVLSRELRSSWSKDV